MALNSRVKSQEQNNLSAHKDIRIKDFTYDLPDERIAKYPLKERDRSKLLIWNQGCIEQGKFQDCINHLPQDAKLVFNNTRVIHARLFFQKETGARIEIFCLEPIDPADYQVAFQKTDEVTWKCMVGNSKKWKSGKLNRSIRIGETKINLTAEKKEQEGNSFAIHFQWDKPFSFAEIIEHTGTLPIPPYLNRETEDSDEESYQTVYAKIDGSVAAPTAGLHFTEDVLSKLHQKGISTSEVTLHVGAGTFQPVKSETISGHDMHHELVVIPKQVIQELIEQSGDIIAVGTTSVRSLESLYWLGLQLHQGTFQKNRPEITQWEPYETAPEITPAKSLQHILSYLEKSGKEYIQFSTQIIILPGYDFKIIRGMFTNFHQPQSTLLLLISAILGDDWKKVYDYALKNNFRFLSYGDSNLYLR